MLEKQIKAVCLHAACENDLRGEGYFEAESALFIRKEAVTASSRLFDRRDPFTG